jgi:dethiobiotin synthetase
MNRLARQLLHRYSQPGIFVTATNTDVGKTTVCAALAGAMRQAGARVGTLKPVASGCMKYPDRGNAGSITDDDLIPSDSITVARMAGLNLDDEGLRSYMSPVRFAAPISPNLAAQLEGRTTDWERVARALDYWEEHCDTLIVEGAGGWMVPLDEHDFTIADLAATLKLPVLVVTTLGLGAISNTWMTVQAIRARNLVVAGLVINKVPATMGLLESTYLAEIPRVCGVPVRAVLPAMDHGIDTDVPQSFVAAMHDFAHTWMQTVAPQ